MRRLLFTSWLVVLCATISAQEWMDVTEKFVNNPSFNGSVDGWVVNYNSSTAKNFGYQGAYYSNNDVWISQFVEAWRDQSRTFSPSEGGVVWKGNLGNGSIYQTLTELPSGKYKLEADAIAVDQNANRNPVTGVLLFIADSSNEASQEMATGNGAPEHFSVEFDTQASQLTIGVRTESTMANWLALDNVKLSWKGQEVKPTSITLNASEKELVQGESFTLVPTLVPANTTFKGCLFESSNEACVKVDDDGVVTAIKPGMSTITVRAESKSSITAKCIVRVVKNVVSANAVIINEVQASNVDMFIDPSFNYGDWIELYNSTDKNVALDGLYISDDPTNPKKFQLTSSLHGFVPAKGYCTLWFDHYSWWAPKMIDLELDYDGGDILIADEEGTILSQMTYPPAISRTSYARTTDGGNQWEYTDQPTPGSSNNSSAFANIRLEEPVIDTDGCLFTGTILAQVTNIPEGATLRYTLDGSTPTLTNGSTSTDGLFSFSQTAVLRLRFFQQGYLSSAVVTRSYIYKDKNYTLPVISIVSDNANLYGDDYGIFVQGNGNGRPGNGKSFACNWNMDWDRPVNFEYFTENGQAVFSQEVGIEASGGWSRAWTPHSFNIKASKIYEGANRMNYQFFENKPFLRHKALKVRNGGNDNNNRIKDAAIQQVVTTAGLYAETQSYKPVHVFHNGAYIGVENLREPNSKNYASANYGIDTDDEFMDQWKMSPDSGYVQQVGTKDIFDEWYSLAQNASDALAYERIKSIVDIEEYINYMAVELYIAGQDWPKNNIKAFRERSEGLSNSRFRFVLFDTDGAFSTDNAFTWFAYTQNWTYDQLYGQQVIDKYGNRITEEIEFTTIFLNMLQNAEFKKQFADQFCLVAGSVFEPNRSAEIINAMVNHVNPAMQLEGRSSSNTANNVISNLSSARQENSVTNMKNYLGLAEPLQVTLSANIDEARLLVNDLQVQTNKFAGKLFSPITLKASAPAGYQFLGWKSNQSKNTSTVFSKGSQWNYYDQGSLDGVNWTAKNYSASWSAGYAPLGYFTSDASNARGYQTTLNYGGTPSNKYPTYYFRKKVTLSQAPNSADSFTLDWVADDGFIIYVNGVEAGRYLMPSGNASFNTFATTYAHSNPDAGQMTLDASLFTSGTNVIAVEVHNNDAKSTDIYWDASLLYTHTGDDIYVSTDETFQLPESTGTYTYTAMYERLNDNADQSWDAHPIKINEVSAGNDIYVNDLFKKNDWIELYNTTDEPYDINGLFISDNLQKPEKFQLIGDGTVSTIIPAHGHMVIWCDKLQSVNQLHADFKLSNADSCSVIITSEDHSWADTLTYCAHTGYQTVGLFPDGSRNIYVMNRPTIGASNVMTTDALAYEEPDMTIIQPDNIEDAEAMELELICKNRMLTFSGATYARLEIYDTSGRLIVAARIQEDTPFSLASLPQGIYLAKASTEDEQISLKVSIQ